MTDALGGHRRPGAEQLVLEAGGARLTIDAGDGGRLTSIVVDGHELLITDSDDPLRRGCYPMVPFAGRIRDGRFAYAGREFTLRRNLPPHAIHGTVIGRAWQVVGPDTLAIDLGPDWPFAGRVHQRFTLTPGRLHVEAVLESDVPMPGAIGWHPWFRRILAGRADESRPPSAPAELRFEADRMWARDAAGIPTGELVDPGPRPWDDCFTGLRSAPRLTWPGVLALELRSSCDQWVVYDEPTEAICIEPQTAPPDFPTIAPVTIAPGAPLRATMDWRWWPAAAGPSAEDAG